MIHSDTSQARSRILRKAGKTLDLVKVGNSGTGKGQMEELELFGEFSQSFRKGRDSIRLGTVRNSSTEKKGNG